MASDPEFTGQPGVVNGASEVLGEIFGEAGRHARSAVGVAVLPLDSPVEVEVVFSSRSARSRIATRMPRRSDPAAASVVVLLTCAVITSSRRVGERRGVADLAALRDVAQQAPHDLAGAGLRAARSTM